MWIVRAEFGIIIACYFNYNCVFVFNLVLKCQEIHLTIMNGNCHAIYAFFFWVRASEKNDMIPRRFAFFSFNTYFSKSIKKTVDKLPKRNWVHFFYQLPIYWIIRFRCCGSMKVFFRSSSTWKYCLVEKKSIGMYNLEACRLAREVNVWIEHFCECHRSVRKRVHFTNEQWWIQTH